MRIISWCRIGFLEKLVNGQKVFPGPRAVYRENEGGDSCKHNSILTEFPLPETHLPSQFVTKTVIKPTMH